MSGSKIASIVGAILTVVVGMINAILNFIRLQLRSDAPGVGDYVLYVGLPIMMVMAATFAIGLILFLHFKSGRHGRTTDPEKPGPQSALPTVAPSNPTMPTSELKVFDPEALAEDVSAQRTRIWSIIDELSEALRSDDLGSEALFTVRERFHRIQFAPIATEEPEEPAPAPKKTPASTAA